jgi:hypothetical protein
VENFGLRGPERNRTAIGVRKAHNKMLKDSFSAILPQRLKSVRENSSFAPLGLHHFPLVPTAYAVGFILSPLRG